MGYKYPNDLLFEKLNVEAKKIGGAQKVTVREFQMLELLLTTGYTKRAIANIMGIKEKELHRKLSRLEKKFPGFRDRIRMLRSEGEMNKKPITYYESDLPMLKKEHTQIVDGREIFVEGKWQKMIGKI